jgi:hypothetical protein
MKTSRTAKSGKGRITAKDLQKIAQGVPLKTRIKAGAAVKNHA